MDTDSPSSPPLNPRELVVQRLIKHGIPEELLCNFQSDLVTLIREKKLSKTELVTVILPSEEEKEDDTPGDSSDSERTSSDSCLKDQFRESMYWLQWIMFEGDPAYFLKTLASMTSGQRGVCGAVWGQNDIAYRCLTCELDRTCAICVPCFLNGNHENHDYSTINTGGGCCDCGDVTAWKREGFCSNHKGADEIQPLPEEYACSVGSVLNPLLLYWKNKLFYAEADHQENYSEGDPVRKLIQFTDELTYAVVEMLLDFCHCSESLLSFISKQVCSLEGFMDILVRAERHLSNVYVKKHHELFLKLLAEPVFKFEFAKAFTNYYPAVVHEAIKQSGGDVHQQYPLLWTFSVQILTVPTLIPRLVEEMNLLDMLVGCLEDIFITCAGDDGRVQLSKWSSLSEIAFRVLIDIRFVLSHDDVPKYVVNGHKNVLRTWVRVLGFMQGIDPQMREKGIHVEDENDQVDRPFHLDHYVADIHSLLVAGAYAKVIDEVDTNNGERLRYAKVGRVAHESSVCSATVRDNTTSQPLIAFQVDSDAGSRPSVPSSVTWLASECLRVIENWLISDIPSSYSLNAFSPTSEFVSGSNFVAFRRTISKIRRGSHIFRRFSRVGELSKRNASNSQTGLGIESGKFEKLDGSATCSKGSGYETSSNTVDPMDCSLEVDSTAESGALRVLSLSDWPCIEHDVSSQEVSLHIPLHRLLSSMLQQGLRQSYGESVMTGDTASVSSGSQPALQSYIGKFLGSCHPNGFSAFLMEHPLRIRAFCAQVHAGMWRRNGDAARISLELYRKHWTEQILELDLFLLQCCATLAPPDSFVNRIVERFGLSDYLTLKLERSFENEAVLVQEMLSLLIQIVNERRLCGMSVTDSLKRELIKRLSVGDATRSQLVKSLSNDLKENHQLQEILNNIASYSNPSCLKQGMYSLRVEFWKELDLYHPRWNPKDLQVAEERYLRFCHVSALTTQIPRWTNIYSLLSGVAKVANCRAVLKIIRSVLYYAVFTELMESRAPDSVLLAALHLLALGLDICTHQIKSSDTPGSIPLLAFASEKIVCGTNRTFSEQSLLSLLVLLMRMCKKDDTRSLMEAGSYDISSFIGTLLKKFAELEIDCLIALAKLAPELIDHTPHSANQDGNSSIPPDNESRKMKARERQAAMLAKMKAEQSKFLASINVSHCEETSEPNTEQNSEYTTNISVASNDSNDICSLCHDQSSKSSVSYLVHLQKSRLLNFADNGYPSWAHPQPGMDAVASKRSERSSISISGSDIVSESVQLLRNAVAEVSSDGRMWDEPYVQYLREQFPPPQEKYQSLSPWIMGNDVASLQIFETLEVSMHASIVGQVNDQLKNTISIENETTFLHFSGSPNCQIVEKALTGEQIIGCTNREVENASDIQSSSLSPEKDRLLVYSDFGPMDCDGVFLSSCGHAVHQGCLDRYLSSLKERHSRRVTFEGAHIVDLNQGEFLCPVCRLLANSVLPALPSDPQWQPLNSFTASAPEECIHLSVRRVLYLLQVTATTIKKKGILEALLIKNREREDQNLEPTLQALYSLYMPRTKNKFSSQFGARHSSIMWDTLKYTLMSVEIAARTGKTSLMPTHNLDSLYSELKSSGEIVFQLLVKTVNKRRSGDPRQVFLRFHGIQLLADSICIDYRLEGPIYSPSGRRYVNLSSRERSELAMPYYDLRFWERASDPVLAHDPFSSLMWTLFCLPSPFLSCKETFRSLVHIYYIACVTQATVAYCVKFRRETSELGLQDCMISDIIKFVGDSRVARQYFISKCTDKGGKIHDEIRRMTFPFLRRCALLSKVLSFSTAWIRHEKSSSAYDDVMNLTDVDVELAEIEKLEHMYRIPSLDVVLKEKYLRLLVSKWLQRFDCDIGDCSFPNSLYSTPAVPFRLMHLPHVYQDLLQRCIKQRCSSCKKTIEDPALCLLCGRLCSSMWRRCCSENGFESHAMACGASTGVYLLVRKTTVLLQRCARQALWPSPYLDAFGEEDQNLQRGKPLYLNQERYAALSYMVASHGLDRNSKVLRQTTMGNFFMI